MTEAGAIAAIQKRTVRVLASGQVLGGLAFGATISFGALLAADVSGDASLSGLSTAALTFGAALCAVPLARLAARRGRRRSLTLGNAFAMAGIIVLMIAAAVRSFPLLIVGILMIGAGNAGNLQSRFAALDLAEPSRRGRDLATVVWATTVGAVAGPLLSPPGEALGAGLGMPVFTGPFLFSLIAQGAALALYLVALRPDPLLVAQRLNREAAAGGQASGGEDRPRAARYAMVAVACSHATMASVMAMTPVHVAMLMGPGVVAGHAHSGGGHEGHAVTSGDTAQLTVVVSVMMALHVFGMFGLSPVMGLLADRIGQVRIILLGQGIFVAALVLAATLHNSIGWLTLALFLLGLGWSAATVAGSALLTSASAPAKRPGRQGFSDTTMTLAAGIGSIAAGVILGWAGYAVLALLAFALVAVVVLLSPMARARIGSRGD